MMGCNVLSPQIFWFRKMRRNLFVTFFMSILVNIGMWFERFVIIVTSLHRDFLPSSWTMFYPTWVDVGIFIGTLGIFFTLYLLFSRAFPVIAIAETKSILKQSGDGWKKRTETDYEKVGDHGHH
jgi:Ni/Fe-hydrogenase subunit HybB-like protein